MQHAYPRLGLPLPLELANTVFAQSGQLYDALTTPAELHDWLHANATHGSTPMPAADAAHQLERFRALRDALRQLFSAVAEGIPPPQAALQTLNSLSAEAPQFAQLDWLERTPRLTLVDVADASAAASVARASIELLASPVRERIGVCQAPGCVLFFLKERRRRHWCSAACGNRARVARHYARHRRGGNRDRTA